MNWDHKVCSVLLFCITLMCTPIVVAQAKPMKQSEELRQLFSKLKQSANWSQMTPAQQADEESKTVARLRELEAEEAREAAQQQPVTQPVTPKPEPVATVAPRPTKELHDLFIEYKNSANWEALTPEQQQEKTNAAVNRYRQLQEMENTAEIPDVEQIESREMRSFSETNSEFAFFIYATIFAAIFLIFRYLSSKMRSGETRAVFSTSKQALNSKIENTTMPNDVCGNEAYAQALSEIENNRIDKGLWAKHFAETDGDENRTKARYLKSRVEIIGKKSATVHVETAYKPATQVCDPGRVFATNRPPDETRFGICGECTAINSATACSCDRCQNQRPHVAETATSVTLSDKPNREAGDAQTDEYSKQMAVIKTIGYIVTIYALSLLAFFINFPEFKDFGYLIRFFAMGFGGVAVLNLGNLVRLGPVTTFVLIVFPIIGWVILLYYAYVNNICDAETKMASE